MADDLSLLEDKIGYRFKDAALLQLALTHSSKMGEKNNERLEFLGDRVLNLVIAAALYQSFPDEAEGQLAKRNTGLVQARTLASVASDLGLGHFLDVYGGVKNDNILADTLEAVIAAVYLDGGMEPADKLVLALFGERLHLITEIHSNTKSELQEFVLGKGLPLPAYEIMGKSGPDHAPVFEVQVSVRGQEPARGQGGTRQAAEKEAARLMLERMKDKT